MSTHVMIDLETMDSGGRAIIVSVGLAKFNDQYKVVDKLYAVLDMEAQEKLGRTISSRTMKWWLSQSDEARAVFKRPDTNELVVDMELISEFMTGAEGVWGNGADFDNMILGSLYHDMGLKRPWSYAQNRCFRTLKKMFPAAWPKREGVHHHALDDAVYQVEWLKNIMEKMNAETD